MKSVDYVRTFLDKQGLAYEVYLPTNEKHVWKWHISVKDLQIYMIHNSRFLVMKLDNEGLLVNIEPYIQSKYEVVERIKKLL